jgi:transposase
MSMTTETTADADAVGLGRGGRMSRQRKRETVLRLLQGVNQHPPGTPF